MCVTSHEKPMRFSCGAVARANRILDRWLDATRYRAKPGARERRIEHDARCGLGVSAAVHEASWAEAAFGAAKLSLGALPPFINQNTLLLRRDATDDRCRQNKVAEDGIRPGETTCAGAAANKTHQLHAIETRISRGEVRECCCLARGLKRKKTAREALWR